MHPSDWNKFALLKYTSCSRDTSGCQLFIHNNEEAVNVKT